MRTREALRAAKKAGREAGEAAASWYFDGNTTPETYARVLKGIEDGDPEILDSFPYPNLSGEWAGDPTPRSLADDCGLEDEDERAEWLISDLCSAWEDAFSTAVHDSIEKEARRNVRRTA